MHVPLSLLVVGRKRYPPAIELTASSGNLKKPHPILHSQSCHQHRFPNDLHQQPNRTPSTPTTRKSHPQSSHSSPGCTSSAHWATSKACRSPNYITGVTPTPNS